MTTQQLFKAALDSYLETGSWKTPEVQEYLWAEHKERLDELQTEDHDGHALSGYDVDGCDMCERMRGVFTEAESRELWGK